MRKVSSNSDITGINIQKLPTQKIATYADDLFFITRPQITLPNLLRAFGDFGALSHLEINLKKSVAMNVSLTQKEVGKLRPSFTFKWQLEDITYLGTKIPSDLSKVFAVNFPPVLKFVKQN